MEPNLDPVETKIHLTNPVQEINAALITSPEYAMKKLLGAGLERIYTITPVFRNNESLGPHNLPEFRMLEWYGQGGYGDLLNETEDLLKHVLEDETPWARLPYGAAQVDSFGEPHTDEKRFFVTEYPVSQASLARLSDDGEYAERFEAFADGLELCNGFCELTDSDEQRKRFEKEKQERIELGKTVFPIDEELLKSLDNIEGSVYGNALGLDRLIMLKYAERDIRDIQLLHFS